MILQLLSVVLPVLLEALLTLLDVLAHGGDFDLAERHSLHMVTLLLASLLCHRCQEAELTVASALQLLAFDVGLDHCYAFAPDVLEVEALDLPHSREVVGGEGEVSVTRSRSVACEAKALGDDAHTDDLEDVPCLLVSNSVLFQVSAHHLAYRQR